MAGKNNYLKIALELANKASDTYKKYQMYQEDPKGFALKEPQLFVTFQFADKFITGAKEKISENRSSDGNKTFTSKQDYYSLLESKTSDTNDVIKSNYKRLVKDYHPDIISGKDLPKPFVEFANKKFQEIHTAYEYIKKERNF